MKIRNFINKIVQTLTSFGSNKAKMNQPAIATHREPVSIPQAARQATTTAVSSPVVPRRVAKQRPAKVSRTERHMALNRASTPVTLIRRTDGKLKKACFVSRAGRLLVAKIVSIRDGEVILRRNGQELSPRPIAV